MWYADNCIQYSENRVVQASLERLGSVGSQDNLPVEANYCEDSWGKNNHTNQDANFGKHISEQLKVLGGSELASWARHSPLWHA